MSVKGIPKTDSIQELAAFWDTHDVTDFGDELAEVAAPVFERRTSTSPSAPFEKTPIARTNRGKHHTGWAGVLATAAELSRRSYDVTITLGNTPTSDILAAATPNGPAFRVEVKSASTPNFVPIQKSILESPVRADLVFVIVIVPRNPEQSFRFFVMTHAEVRAAWQATRKTTKTGQPYKPGWEGLNWGSITSHENCWNKLPGTTASRSLRNGEAKSRSPSKR